MNDTEHDIAHDIRDLINVASRFLYANPGSLYQWETAHQVSFVAQRVRRRLGGDEFKPLPEPIDPERVMEAVAEMTQEFIIGQALYPMD